MVTTKPTKRLVELLTWVYGADVVDGVARRVERSLLSATEDIKTKGS